MAEATELKAGQGRAAAKVGARSVRREGRVPGILYGDKQEPQSIAVDYRAICQQILTGHFQSTIFVLDVDGKKTRVIPRACSSIRCVTSRSMSISCGSARTRW